MSVNVYGVGNALVDIQAQVSDDVVTELDFSKGFTTLIDDATQQRVLQRLDGIPLTRCAGGSAANTIIGIAQFGGTAAYAGKVAGDSIGDFFLEDLRQLGVTIEIPPAAGQSGTCVVLVTDDAQRTMLTNLAVSATLSADDIVEDDVKAAEWIYVEGYLFAGDTLAAARRAIEVAVSNNVKVALTVSDPFIVDLCRDELTSLIEGPVDLLFCNLEEARSLTGQQDPVECAHEIHKHAANVSLTLGGEGSLLLHDGVVTPIEGVPVTAIDTTGAGDMYAAGILYGITNGLSWKQSGHLASHAAGRVVSPMGARLASPFTPEEIQDLLPHA